MAISIFYMVIPKIIGKITYLLRPDFLWVRQNLSWKLLRGVIWHHA